MWKPYEQQHYMIDTDQNEDITEECKVYMVGMK